MKHTVLKVKIGSCNAAERSYNAHIINVNHEFMGMLKIRLVERDKYFHHQIQKYAGGEMTSIYVKLDNFRKCVVKDNHYIGELVSWTNHHKNNLL